MGVGMRRSSQVLLGPACPDPDDPVMARIVGALAQASGARWCSLELRLKQNGTVSRAVYTTGNADGEPGQAVDVRMKGLFEATVRLGGVTRPPESFPEMVRFMLELLLYERRTRRQFALIRAALDTTSLLVLLFDRHANIIYVNPPADLLLSRQTEDEIRVVEPGGTPSPLLTTVVDWVIEMTGEGAEDRRNVLVSLSDGSVMACELVAIRDGGKLEGVVALLQPVAATAGARLPLLAAAYHLTPREQELLQILASGLSTAAAARELGISPHTVKDHLKNLYRKTGTRSRSELLGLLSGPFHPPSPARPEKHEM